MACIVKIKGKEEFKVFDTEADAREYLKDTNVVIEEMINPVTKESELYVNVQDTHSGTVNVIRAANQISWEATKELLTQTKLNDWDTEEYGKRSDAISLSIALANIRVLKGEEYKRLFPEFITNNYLNVLIQTSIARAYAMFKGEAENNVEAIDLIRTTYFDNTLPSEWREDAKLRPAKEWFMYFQEQIKDSEFTLDEETLTQFDLDAQEENRNNLDTMLRGEIIHKIFEMIIKNPVETATRKDKVWNAVTDLLDTFRIKYGEDYDEVPDSLTVIQDLIAGTETSPSLEQVFDSYYNWVVKAKQDIEDVYTRTYRDRGESPTVSWLAEQRITADLDSEVNGKKKIRGKLDAILVVNGVPNIIDLKVSRNDISEWAPEKTLKTKYQLAMYWRLLGKLGLPVNDSGLDIYNITLGKDKTATNGILKSFSTSVKTDSNINTNLDPIFSRAIQRLEVNPKQLEAMASNIESLFGKGSARGQKKANIDYIKTQLRKNAENSVYKGKYNLSYNIWSETGVKLERKTIKGISKENLDSVIDKVAQEIVERSGNRFDNQYETLVSDIREFLNRSDKDISSFASAANSGDIINQLSAVLLKYKGSGAKVINSDLAKQYNMILIETPIGIDIINCLSLNPNIPWDSTNKNAKLFENVPNVVGDRNLKTIGNIEIVKSLLIANDLLKGSGKKLGTIACLQLGAPVGYMMTTANMINNMEIATRFLGINNNLSKDRFVDPLVNVLYMFNQFIDSTKQLSQVGENIKPSKMGNLLDGDKFNLLKEVLTKRSGLDKIKTASSDLIDSTKVELLKVIRQQLKDSFPALFENPGKINVICPETTLMDQIEKALAIYQNREMVCESDISMYGWNSGAMWASMDLIPSENVQIIRTIVDAAFGKIRETFSEYKAINRAQVAKLKKGNDYGLIRHLVVGDSSSNYFNLFRRNSDNELEDDDYILKNPWTSTSLIPAQRDFIKYTLYELNKYSYDKKKYKWNSWRDVKEEQFNREDYFIPLLRAKGLDKFRDPKGGINFPSVRSWYDEIRNKAVQMKDTLEGQIEERKKVSDLFQGVYNEFESRKNPNVRRDIIEKNGGIKNFSMDLETILDTFTIAMESQKVFDMEVIPAIKGALYSIQFQSYVTGKELPNFEEFVRKYVKSAIYNDSIMAPEVQTAYKVIAPVRAAASAVALGWNIMNVPREVIMGFWTNISKAMFASYGKDTFGVGEYIKALGILTGDVPNFIMNVTKVELLNEFYGMANMSITEIPEQATSNKTGVFATFNRFMSWSLTAPDYWNRMSMFIAQMIHDGCWDAHELVESKDGVRELKYNMAKDKRFDIYVKYKGDYSKVPKELKTKFNEQEALYMVMRDDMNKELGVAKQIPSPEPGKVPNLPKAYTDLQRNSFKSFADMSFGYYDKEVKAWFFKTAIGGIFKQFMAFMSAKKMMYFQVRTDQTARGSYEQLTDSSGNKLWSIAINNSPLEVRIVNDKDLEGEYKQYAADAKPKLGWTGAYMEGIFQSYIHLFKDLGIGTYEALRNGDTSVYKKLWKDYGKKGDIRHSNVLQGLYDLLLSTLFITLIRMMFFDDPEVTGISYKKQLQNAGSMFQNLYWIADQSTQDFSVLRLLDQGLFTWEVPSFNILQTTARNFLRAAGDDDLNIAEAALSGTVNSVGMFKPLRPAVRKLTEES